MIPDPDPVDPEVLACFVKFCRMNPEVAADDPLMRRVFWAYMSL